MPLLYYILWNIANWQIIVKQDLICLTIFGLRRKFLLINFFFLFEIFSRIISKKSKFAEILECKQNKNFPLPCFTNTACPNTELFLVHTFLYSDWIRTRNNSVFGHCSRSATITQQIHASSNQLWKHYKKVGSMFKVNNKYTRTMSLTLFLFLYH